MIYFTYRIACEPVRTYAYQLNNKTFVIMYKGNFWGVFFNSDIIDFVKRYESQVSKIDISNIVFEKFLDDSDSGERINDNSLAINLFYIFQLIEDIDFPRGIVGIFDHLQNVLEISYESNLLPKIRTTIYDEESDLIFVWYEKNTEDITKRDSIYSTLEAFDQIIKHAHVNPNSGRIFGKTMIETAIPFTRPNIEVLLKHFFKKYSKNPLLTKDRIEIISSAVDKNKLFLLYVLNLFTLQSGLDMLDKSLHEIVDEEIEKLFKNYNSGAFCEYPMPTIKAKVSSKVK